MGFTGRFIVVIWAIFKVVNCQTKLISSASDGYVCQGRHVVFNCEATGNTLSWSYNSDAIVDYTSFDGVGVQRYMSTDIYSALISNNAGVLVSELIFLSSPNPPSFVVECLAGGIPRSENISVLASSTPPINMNYSMNMDTLIVTVSWGHSQPNSIQRFEILLDGKLHAAVLGSQIVIQLLECKTYMLQIVAVDLCNNTSSTEALPICCTPESTTPTTAEPITTTNVMGQTGASMACAAPAEIKIIKNVAISTLFFVLLLLLCCGVSQIMGVLYLKEKKILCFNKNTRVDIKNICPDLRNECCCRNRNSKPNNEG